MEQEVYLSQGHEVVLQSPGFDSGKYVEGCEVGEVVTNHGDEKDCEGQV